ncbi:hypothetical protein CRENBAI_000293 [Crenichthys baileyi]|uniref:Uncharacterized protein n=1 Tax=Crenichthys baileyi TaxID=28760 RepID=A0AAV9RCD6_9TELE
MKASSIGSQVSSWVEGIWPKPKLGVFCIDARALPPEVVYEKALVLVQKTCTSFTRHFLNAPSIDPSCSTQKHEEAWKLTADTHEPESESSGNESPMQPGKYNPPQMQRSHGQLRVRLPGHTTTMSFPEGLKECLYLG